MYSLPFRVRDCAHFIFSIGFFVGLMSGAVVLLSLLLCASEWRSHFPLIRSLPTEAEVFAGAMLVSVLGWVALTPNLYEKFVKGRELLFCAGFFLSAIYFAWFTLVLPVGLWDFLLPVGFWASWYAVLDLLPMGKQRPEHDEPASSAKH